MGLGKNGRRHQIPPVNEQEIFAELGEDGVARLVAAFYRRVKPDDLLGPMYPADDWEGSEERLRDFLLFRLGGQSAYLEKRGHPRLRMRHMPFAIGIPERDRWVALMDASMEETGVSTATRGTLYDFFFQVADFMRNRPE